MPRPRLTTRPRGPKPERGEPTIRRVEVHLTQAEAEIIRAAAGGVTAAIVRQLALEAARARTEAP